MQRKSKREILLPMFMEGRYHTSRKEQWHDTLVLKVMDKSSKIQKSLGQNQNKDWPMPFFCGKAAKKPLYGKKSPDIEGGWGINDVQAP